MVFTLAIKQIFMVPLLTMTIHSAKDFFSGTGINIANEGRRHSGGVIGSSENKNVYLNNKVDKWWKETELL